MKKLIVVLTIAAALGLLFATQAFAGWVDGYRFAGWVDGYRVDLGFVLPLALSGWMQYPGALWSRIRNRGPEAVDGHKLIG